MSHCVNINVSAANSAPLSPLSNHEMAVLMFYLSISIFFWGSWVRWISKDFKSILHHVAIKHPQHNAEPRPSSYLSGLQWSSCLCLLFIYGPVLFCIYSIVAVKQMTNRQWGGRGTVGGVMITWPIMPQLHWHTEVCFLSTLQWKCN